MKIKLEERFKELRRRKEGAYMPHIYYGDPSEEFSLELIKALAESGADLIEFGFPFSDPIADGPTFQAACERALRNGITPARCIRGIKKLKDERLEIPIIVTSYYNIPYVWGVKSFLREVKDAGGEGIIIPDLPVEEAGEILSESKEIGMATIFFVTPTTIEKRLKKIIEATSGFLYVVNVEGVTGARETLLDSTLELINRAREYTDIPLMAGFGISKKEHAKAVVAAGADGVVTGSSLRKIYEKNLENPEETLRELTEFARKIKEGCVEGYKKRTSIE